MNTCAWFPCTTGEPPETMVIDRGGPRGPYCATHANMLTERQRPCPHKQTYEAVRQDVRCVSCGAHMPKGTPLGDQHGTFFMGGRW